MISKIEILKLVKKCKFINMVVREVPWPESDDKNLPAWVAGIRQILKISSRVLVRTGEW